MAGGFYSARGAGVPLRDRGRDAPKSGNRDRPWLRSVELPTVATASPARQRHAWAQLTPDSEPVPALVIRWVRVPAGWSAWIVAVTADGQAVTVQVAAGQLQPAH